jgi:2-polyprenyl-3-methyl-5-hydroxy-6-metoxy-1,4-benzoquinol methylase
MTLVVRACAVCGAGAFAPVYAATIAADDADPAAYFSSSRVRAGHLEIVRCTHCGLQMTNPGDDDATLARIYAALEDRSYDAEDQSRTATARAQLAFVSRHCDRPGRLLDAGCATGTLARVASEAGWQVTGLDASAWSIERARERCPQATFVQGSLDAAVFPESSFHVVTLCDTLEHVPDPATALRRIRTWLRPGGWLFLNVPNCESVAARVMRRHWVLLLREHLWYFSPRTLGALLQRCGFDAVATRPNFVAHSLANVAGRLAQYEGAPGRMAGRFATNAAAKRIRLRFPIGEMNVAAQRTRERP